MGETRTRPAREQQRFDAIVAANMWFWSQHPPNHITHFQMIREWSQMPDSTKIRRFNAHKYPSAEEESQLQQQTQMALNGMSDVETPRFPES